MRATLWIAGRHLSAVLNAGGEPRLQRSGGGGVDLRRQHDLVGGRPVSLLVSRAAERDSGRAG